MTFSPFFITNATDPTDGLSKNLFLANGFIQHIIPGGINEHEFLATQNTDRASCPVIDATGLVVLPGLVDLHTHLRNSRADSVKTVTTAAVAGGFTTVTAMPNSHPIHDSRDSVRALKAIAEEDARCDVRFVGAVTQRLHGVEIVDMQSLFDEGVVIFSDDGHCVHNPRIMQQALRFAAANNCTIAQHAQDPVLSETLSSPACPQEWPPIAESVVIARDILLALEAGARLHICHVSARQSVDAIAWGKTLGAQITAEVTPHHLLFPHEFAYTGDTRFKVNPPLRSKDDVEYLRDAVIQGVIDIIATDHAPHRNKSPFWQSAPNGMTGLEFALSAIQKVFVNRGDLTWPQVCRIISRKPSEILQEKPNEIREGCAANLVLYNPNIRRLITFDNSVGASNSPYAGLDMPGQVTHTFYKGRLVFENQQCP